MSRGLRVTTLFEFNNVLLYYELTTAFEETRSFFSLTKRHALIFLQHRYSAKINSLLSLR